MIRRTKLNKPDVLTKNGTAWTTEYLDYLGRGGDIPKHVVSRYRHEEIKTRIKLETDDKCVYCETKITATSYGDVEHILPKSKYPNLIFDWENLTFACQVCNETHKRDHDNPALVHPYTDDPSDYLISDGPLILGKTANQKGQTTEAVLQLNRSQLLLRRAERLKGLISLIDRWSTEQDPAFKSVLENELRREADADREYAFCVKTFLLSRGVTFP